MLFSGPKCGKPGHHFAALFVLAGCIGCGQGDAKQNPPTAQISANAPATSEQPKSNGAREIWEDVYLQGTKVGYANTRFTGVEKDGRQLLKIDAVSRFTVRRVGQSIQQEVSSSSLETPQGELISFESAIRAGPSPTVVKGHVADGKLMLETITAGKTVASSIPWSADIGGFSAVEQSLARQPMKPGEKRRLRGLLLGFNLVGTIDLIAQSIEPTQLLDHTVDLLRIENKVALPDGNSLESTLWTNPAGEMLKTRFEALKQETYRTTRERAIAESDSGKVDLILGTTVKVDRRLSSPHELKRIKYRVKLDGEDPSKVFASGLTQEVNAVDPHTAEILVRSVRPDELAKTDAHPNIEPPPGEDERQSNNLIQSDAPEIMAMAKLAAGNEKNPSRLAVALERFVNRSIKSKNFSQAFATAAEVAKSKEGDCTEHAVLLAALARANGIPARVAIGLVYVPVAQGFGYHMWTEVWLNDRWIPLDATLGQGGIGAAHIKLAHAALKGASAYSSFLPVAQVMGRLKIEVLEVE